MMQLPSHIASFVRTEVSLKSSYGAQTNIDTFRRWIATIIFCVTFYTFIYFFEDFWIWLSRLTSYNYVPTSPGKNQWHRITFGVMCTIVVVSGTLQYLIHMSRRFRAFRNSF